MRTIIAFTAVCLLALGSVYLFVNTRFSSEILSNSLEQVGAGKEASQEDSSARMDLPDEIIGPPKEDVALLADFPGFGHNEHRDELIFSEEELARQRLVSECMKAVHFEYIPHPTSILVTDEMAADRDRLLEEYEKLLADPNMAHYESLSPAEKISYNLALYGLADPQNPETDYDESGESDSCISRAYAAIPGVYATRIKLDKEYSAMLADIDSDATLRLARFNWSRCMRENGFDIAHSNELRNLLEEAQMKLEDGEIDQDGYIKLVELNEAVTYASDECSELSKLGTIEDAVIREYENAFAKKYLIHSP